MKKKHSKNPLLTTDIVKSIFAQLRNTDPCLDSYDVVWPGPYIVVHGSWLPSSFSLYNDQLFCSITEHGRPSTFIWNIKTNETRTEGHFQRTEWDWYLPILNEKLAAALSDLPAYKRRLARMPLAYRTGKIKRINTWGEGKPVIQDAVLKKLRAAIDRDMPLALTSLTVNQYLLYAYEMYKDAGLKKDISGRLIEVYKSHADGRHGGLLDLPPDDPKAFVRWYHSSERSGSHPWEIVYGNPHGIIFTPVDASDRSLGIWTFYLSVDSPSLYMAAVRMALALDSLDVPFEFVNHDTVIQALRGEDDVTVGPGQDLMLDELKAERPDSMKLVKWDKPDMIRPIAAYGKARIAYVLKHKTPAGFKWKGKEIRPGGLTAPNE